MILDQIVEDKKIRLKEHKNKTSPDEIRRMAEEQVKIGSSFYDALKKDQEMSFPSLESSKRRPQV